MHKFNLPDQKNTNDLLVDGVGNEDLISLTIFSVYICCMYVVS